MGKNNISKKQYALYKKTKKFIYSGNGETKKNIIRELDICINDLKENSKRRPVKM